MVSTTTIVLTSALILLVATWGHRLGWINKLNASSNFISSPELWDEVYERLEEIPEKYKECEGSKFYTNSNCVRMCLESSSLTLATPKPTGDWFYEEISCHNCPHHSFRDPLFSFVREQHKSWVQRGAGNSKESWGKALDAGTGVYSFNWLLGLPFDSVFGITASKEMSKNVVKGCKKDPKFKSENLIVGNWMNSLDSKANEEMKKIRGEKFDFVLVDYLIGSMEAFSPFRQEKLVKVLKPFVKSRIYLVGQEPYGVPLDWGKLSSYNNRWDRDSDQLTREIAMNIFKLRDSIIMLVGERYYREYPAEWVVDNLKENGYIIDEVRLFPINWGKKALETQIDLCSSKIDWAMKHFMVSDRTTQKMIEALKDQIVELRILLDSSAIAEKHGVCFGMDWVISAHLPEERNE